MSDHLSRYAPCGLIELDVDGAIVSTNAVFAEWMGRKPVDLAGLRLRSLIDEPDVAEAIARAADDQTSGPSGARALTAKLLRTDLPPLPVLVSWSRHENRIFAALFDATNREAFETRVSRQQMLSDRQENRLKLLLRSAVQFADALEEEVLAEELAYAAEDAYAASGATVFMIDDRAQIVIAAGKNPFGDEALGQVFGDQALQLRTVVTVSDVTASPIIPKALADTLTAVNVRGMLVAPIVHEGQQMGLLAVFFDAVRDFDEEAVPLADALSRQAGQVLARIRLTKRLHRAAQLDDITGLPNRRLFEQQLQHTASSNALVCVAFIDLDGFKSVNDALGHDGGDDVLREVARRIQRVVREHDSVARYGGDEFVAVWAVNDQDAARQVAERILASVAQPYAAAAGLPISASIGLAVSETRPEPAATEQLVRLADQAMYRAKGEGGNRVLLVSDRG